MLRYIWWLTPSVARWLLLARRRLPRINRPANLPVACLFGPEENRPSDAAGKHVYRRTMGPNKGLSSAEDDRRRQHRGSTSSAKEHAVTACHVSIDATLAPYPRKSALRKAEPQSGDTFLYSLHDLERAHASWKSEAGSSSQRLQMQKWPTPSDPWPRSLSGCNSVWQGIRRCAARGLRVGIIRAR